MCLAHTANFFMDSAERPLRKRDWIHLLVLKARSRPAELAVELHKHLCCCASIRGNDECGG